MIQRLRHDSKTIELLLVGRIRRALRLLVEAAEYARRVACDPWEFAVDIAQFRRLELTDNDLRFLMRMKCLDHAEEVTSSADIRRVFRSTGAFILKERTCFVLTQLGLSLAESLVSAKGSDRFQSCIVSLSAGQEQPLLPFWDSRCRVLSFEGRTVKKLRRQAINQERVLAAFQEENWPKRIFDPLVPQPCQDLKRRLNDTVKCLNRRHQHRLLHFRGDGTGEGVLWEFVG